jgi:hypothetical protein
MYLNNRAKAAIAAAALVAAAGGAGIAYTSTGITTTGTAAAPQFVGGTITQTVSGATLDEIKYGFADAPANTQVKSVKLTFADATNGLTPTILLAGATVSGDHAGTWLCEAIGNTTAAVSTCNITTGYYVTGLTGIDVTVASTF